MGDVNEKPLGEVNEMTLAEFAVSFLPSRDELAFRKLRGEHLSAREQSDLNMLNAELERLLPKPERLSAETIEIMAELKRLVRR